MCLFSFVPSPREIIPGLPRRHEVGGGMACALLIMELVLGGRKGNREGVWAVRAHLPSRRCPLGPRTQRRHMVGDGEEDGGEEGGTGKLADTQAGRQVNGHWGGVSGQADRQALEGECFNRCWMGWFEIQ